MPAEDDILLLQLIKQDDEKAFKHLFDTYFVSLCRFMARIQPMKYTFNEENELTISFADTKQKVK